MYDEWKKFYSDQPCMVEVDGKWKEEVVGSYELPSARFDEKERNDFVFLLKGYPLDSTKPFLEDLAEVCHARKHLDGPGSAEEKRRYAAPIIKNLRKTQAQLKSLRVSKLNIRENIDLRPNSTIRRDFEQAEFGLWQAPWQAPNPCFDIEQLAVKAEPHISALIENLEKYIAYITKKRTGRKSADASEFCFSIGKLFLKHFGEIPSADRNGIFFLVIKLSLETIGLPMRTRPGGLSLPYLG